MVTAYPETDARETPRLLAAAFLLYVFTLPLENLNTSLNLGSVTVPRLAGLLLFGLSIIYFSKSFSSLPIPLWLFGAHVLVFGLLGLSEPPIFMGPFKERFFTRIQVVVFFWLAANLMRDLRLAKKALLTFALSNAFLLLGNRLGLPGLVTYELQFRAVRTTIYGWSLDYLSIIMLMAALIFIGFGLEKMRRLIVFIPLIVAVLSMMVATGSRGSVVAFIFGVACYLLPVQIDLKKFVGMALAVAALSAVGYLIMSNPDSMDRWNATLKQGDTAQRDVIAGHTFKMILERPILGWGPISYQYELFVRQYGFFDVSAYQDPHNLEMAALIEDGLLGALPFLIGIGMCWKAAWDFRQGALGIVPFALLTSLIVNLQFTPYSTGKPLWLVLAICWSSCGFVRERSRELQRKRYAGARSWREPQAAAF